MYKYIHIYLYIAPNYQIHFTEHYTSDLSFYPQNTLKLSMYMIKWYFPFFLHTENN